MKLNKSKNKGKVHPFSLSSSSSSTTSTDPSSSLNLLLPAAILTLISTLSLQDRQVLAYMITHSLNSSNPDNKPDNPKRKPKKLTNTHQKSSPSFDCDCFDCYTAFWYRWDSSPHRELIHQAIEAFEEHLATSEMTSPKKSAGKSKRKEKQLQSPEITSPSENQLQKSAGKSKRKEKRKAEEHSQSQAQSPEIVIVEERVEAAPAESVESPANDVESPVGDVEERESGSPKQQQQQQGGSKGLARKVLPDVIGLLNSRLWNLWGPNV